MNKISLFTEDIKEELGGLIIGSIFFLFASSAIGIFIDQVIAGLLFSLISSIFLFLPYLLVYNAISFGESKIIINNLFFKKSIKYSDIEYISELRGPFLKLKAKRNYYLLGHKSFGMKIDSENRTINTISSTIKKYSDADFKLMYLQGISIVEK